MGSHQRVSTIARAALCLILLLAAGAGAARTLVDGAKTACASGSLSDTFGAVLFDPALPGDGFYLVRDAANLSAAFFGYDAEGELLWLVGTIPAAGTNGAVDVSIPLVEVGPRGRFAVPQDPLSDPIPAWGSLSLSLACTGSGVVAGTATLDGPDGRKELALESLVAGGQGTNDGGTLRADRLGAVLFDASAPGDGLYLVGDSNSVSIAFFGYEADGQPLWLVSTVPAADAELSLGGTTRFPLVVGGPQGGFAVPQSPLLTPLPAWGGLDLTLDCSSDGALVGEAVLDGIDGAKPLSLSAILDLGSCPEGFEPEAIEIATDAGETPAYTPVPLEVSTALSFETLVIEIDVSGSGSFRADETIRGPLPVESGEAQLIPPPLGYFQSGSSYRYQVRVVGPGGASSNTLTLRQTPKGISTVPRGMSSITMDMITRLMFSELGDPIVSGAAAQVQPGATEELLEGLGEDSDDLNESAAELLESAFGFDVDDYPPDGRKGMDGPSRAVTAIFDCLAPRLASNEFSPTQAAAACLEIARESVLEGIIPALDELHGPIALATSRLSSLLANRGGRRLTGYAESIAFSVRSTAFANSFAQLALRLPPVEDGPGELVDFVDGKLTEYGRGRLYETVTRDLTAFDRELLAVLGGPGVATAVAGLDARQIAALRGLESEALNTVQLRGQLQQSPASYGGTGEAQSGPPGVPFPGGDFIGGDLSPEEACAQDPELPGIAEEFGFPSCEAFVRPFLDQVFLQSTIFPLLDEFTRLFQELETAGCFLPTGAGSAACLAITQRAESLLSRIIDALFAYDSGTCASGYRSFDLGSSLTCVWEPLVVSVGSRDCPAGSRVPPYDLGQPACVNYSREFLRNGQCPANYALIFFAPIGAETCRWATLPASLPAAYAQDKATRSRRTLER